MWWAVSLLKAHAEVYPGSCVIPTPAVPGEVMPLRAFCAACGL